MITIKKFVFNPFEVNTYLLFDEHKKAVLIDCACYDDEEQNKLFSYIKNENLTIIRQLYTHCHIDHIVGMAYATDTFEVAPEIHQAALPFIDASKNADSNYGFRMKKIIKPEIFLNHNDIIKFGNSQLEVRYTPGHADGSICLVNHEKKFVISGDVLFYGSIGRTDFPTGNHQVLINNIKKELFTLGDDYDVYPGHGPKTSIGFEKANNPYLN